MKKKDQFVLVYWKDAALHGTSQVSRKYAKEKMGLVKGISGGILVHEDKDQITMATDWFHQDDDFRNVSTIPKSGIYKIKRYRFNDEKEAKKKS